MLPLRFREHAVAPQLSGGPLKQRNVRAAKWLSDAGARCLHRCLFCPPDLDDSGSSGPDVQDLSPLGIPRAQLPWNFQRSWASEPRSLDVYPGHPGSSMRERERERRIGSRREEKESSRVQPFPTISRRFVPFPAVLCLSVRSGFVCIGSWLLRQLTLSAREGH